MTEPPMYVRISKIRDLISGFDGRVSLVNLLAYSHNRKGYDTIVDKSMELGNEGTRLRLTTRGGQIIAVLCLHVPEAEEDILRVAGYNGLKVASNG